MLDEANEASIRPDTIRVMRVTVIAGGVGSARFLAGLVRVLDPSDITVVVNTGDDERMRGLHVSPDIDTVLYHLAGATDWDRGWGLDDETFVAHERYRELVSRADVDGLDMQEWFALGDRDLATHMLRTRLLDAGRSLSDATAAVARGLGVGITILPMSDDPVATKLRSDDGELLDFQTYFVRKQHSPTITQVVFEGASSATAAPGVLDAIGGADVLIIPPSNPLISVAPVLAVPRVRHALEGSVAKRFAVSPIVGGKAIKGPADALMQSLGHEVTATGVARIYAGLVDTFVLDQVDAAQSPAIEALGFRSVMCDSLMKNPDEAARIAKTVLMHAR